MIEEYKLITHDTFNKLEIGKVYKIKDKRYIVNDRENCILYSITKSMLKEMFEKVEGKNDNDVINNWNKMIIEEMKGR